MKSIHLLSLLCIFLFVNACTPELKKEEQKEIIVEEEIEIPEKVSFPSLDGLSIHANFYENKEAKAIFVLCHQAGWNKVEYVKSAIKLMEEGYNCLAIDQRSGDNLLEWFNETKLEAEKAEKATEYLDAEQDIKAAVSYAAEQYKLPVILVGSSYSSTLVLAIAGQMEEVKAVVAFSPGNYFEEKEERLGLAAMLESLGDKPFWITSSKEEATEFPPFLEKLELTELQGQFIPKGDGKHGARALWQTDPDHEEYWTALLDFVGALKF